MNRFFAISVIYFSLAFTNAYFTFSGGDILYISTRLLINLLGLVLIIDLWRQR